MSKLKYLPFAVIGTNLLIALIAYAASAGRLNVGPLVFANLILMALAAVMFMRSTRGVRRAVQRSGGAIDALAASAFDAPATVTSTFESSIPGGVGALTPGGALLPAPGFTARGTYRGVPPKIATGTSSAGRQRFELFHTYSHVIVGAENAAGRVRFVGRDQMAQWSRLFGELPDHKIGDARFDALWVVAGDPDIARDLLDDATRAQLTSLQQRAYGVSSIGMSVELTGEGLVVRWPGELDAALGHTLRDLAMTLRERLLSSLRRDGLIDDANEVRVDATASSPGPTGSAARETPATDESLLATKGRETPLRS